MAENENKLHWTQRIALIRHNLHASSRSGDFTFFRALQASCFMTGTNDVSALSNMLGDEADTYMAAMDNLNAGLAYAHQDAFKNVYDNLKQSLRGEKEIADVRSRLFVDCSMQRNLADLSIDKMTSSTINLIQSQPMEAQELATDVWVTGILMVADAVDVSLKHMEMLENYMEDYIRVEESWNVVKAAVVCAITGVKGVFELMDPSSFNAQRSSPRNSSIASAGASVFRRLSNAFAPSPANSRAPSVASVGAGPPMSSFTMPTQAPIAYSAPVYRTPNFRNTGAKNSPGNLSFGSSQPSYSQPNEAWAQHKLTTIPPTPAFVDDSKDPFDTTAIPAVPEAPDVVSSDLAGSPFSTEMIAPTAVV